MTDDLDPLDQPISRRAARRSLLYCGLVVGLVLGGLVLAAGYEFVQAGRTRAALCVFRADLQRRSADGRAFLVKHPAGVPGLASAADIRTSIRNQERSVRALSGLSCPAPTPPTATP